MLTPKTEDSSASCPTPTLETQADVSRFRTLNGRFDRKQFAVSMGLLLVGHLVFFFSPFRTYESLLQEVLYAPYQLTYLVPYVRRLHDVGQRGYGAIFPKRCDGPALDR